MIRKERASCKDKADVVNPRRPSLDPKSETRNEVIDKTTLEIQRPIVPEVNAALR